LRSAKGGRTVGAGVVAKIGALVSRADPAAHAEVRTYYGAALAARGQEVPRAVRDARSHKRLIEIENSTPQTTEFLKKLDASGQRGRRDQGLIPHSKAAAREQTTMNGLIGRKLGMTRTFDQEDGGSVPVTVIEAGPCVVTQVKTAAGTRQATSAVQLGFGAAEAQERADAPMQGHFAQGRQRPAARRWA
jgi:hypothetical protein